MISISFQVHYLGMSGQSVKIDEKMEKFVSAVYGSPNSEGVNTLR